MPILVNRADYLAVAWSAPMRDLATKVGLSNVGLKKLFEKSGFTIPPQGYWNKVRAGWPAPLGPVAPPRTRSCRPDHG